MQICEDCIVICHVDCIRSLFCNLACQCGLCTKSVLQFGISLRIVYEVCFAIWRITADCVRSLFCNLARWICCSYCFALIYLFERFVVVFLPTLPPPILMLLPAMPSNLCKPDSRWLKHQKLASDFYVWYIAILG